MFTRRFGCSNRSSAATAAIDVCCRYRRLPTNVSSEGHTSAYTIAFGHPVFEAPHTLALHVLGIVKVSCTGGPRVVVLKV